MGLYLSVIEDKGKELPEPTPLKDIKLGKNDVPYLVEVFMPEAKVSVKPAFVKKTLTLPSSLAARAEKVGVNFSKVLRDALEEYLRKDKTVNVK